MSMYTFFSPLNRVNSRELRRVVDEAIDNAEVKPNKIRFFRGAMFNMVSTMHSTKMKQAMIWNAFFRIVFIFLSLSIIGTNSHFPTSTFIHLCQYHAYGINTTLYIML